MNKGSFIQFVKGETAHRFPKVVALAVTSSVLVAMIAIDASASPRGIANSVAGSSSQRSFLAGESSLVGLFGFGLHHNTPTTTTTTTATTPSGGGGGGSALVTTTTAPPATTTTAPPATTTTVPAATTTTTDPTTPVVSGGLITAGPSRSECLAPDTTPGVYGLASLESLVSGFESLTNSTVTCLTSYLNGAPTWAYWDSPWITQSQFGYTSWVAQDPQTRELVLQVNLIPDSLENVSDPLSWEQSCAAGDFNSYATTLGTNLVAAGLQNSVIRLGAEMNGTWEADFVGTTTQEQNLWAQCFANEVTGLRAAAGEHFLIDWNPNACTENIPYANFYPGNAYVDIMGLDFYDVGCDAPTTLLSFPQLAGETAGLTSFEAFANAQGKPMSFPEWGLATSPAGDDPQYVDGIGSTVAKGDFAFESYFDAGAGSSMPLGTDTPLSVAAFQQWFGSGS
jgi:hypothetical protein